MATAPDSDVRRRVQEACPQRLNDGRVHERTVPAAGKDDHTGGAHDGAVGHRTGSAKHGDEEEARVRISSVVIGLLSTM